jgi:hypothetical protein
VEQQIGSLSFLNLNRIPSDILMEHMNADETEVFEFLKDYAGAFVSVTEISRRLKARHKHETDRAWARPILRRMEVDGLLESNPYGEYRLRANPQQPTSFKAALRQPGASLGETTLIFLDDVPPGEETPKPVR